MWNYSFTMPSAMILLILVIFYFRRPRMPIRMNITFLELLFIHTMTLVTDYMSSRVDETFTLYPAAYVYSLNLVFFVFFLARIYWFFLFTLDILGNHAPLPGRLRKAAPLVFILSELTALSSPFTNAVFFMDARGYHPGRYYGVLYVCFFFYLIAAAILILRNGRRLPSPVRNSLLSVVMILAVGNIVRMLLPMLLVMNTFCLMSILVLYLSFENPDLFLSDRGDAFNLRAFKLVLTEWSRKNTCHLVSFIIRDYSEIRGIYGGVLMDKGIRLISEYLSGQFPKCLVFYLRNGSFALVSPTALDARRISGEIASRFQKPWISDEKELMLTPAFLEVQMDRTGTSADHVISTLLLALENAARTGYLEDPAVPISIQAIDQYLIDRQSLESALTHDRLEVFLQPLVDSATGHLVAAEALSRIRRENGELIPPSVFIPIAEKDGSIIPLGEQVLRRTCRFIRDNDLQAMGLKWINVNLSPYQCMSPDLAARFRVILEDFAVPAELIHLELTEQSINDYSLLEHQLLALQELGFQFALDDYGSGHSNLTRVREYPFKNIKLDMAIVRNYFRDRDPLLPALVQGFKQMGFSITAEGIETKEMADALAEIGCDYLQGYYFSQPVSMSVFLARYRTTPEDREDAHPSHQ